MKHIKLTIGLTDDLGIKSCAIDYNDTGLQSNSELVKKVAFTLLRSYSMNKEDTALQDLLNELNIKW